MKENFIKKTSFSFAIRIVNLCKYLNQVKNEFVFTKQLLRSGTAIGALYREAEHAESKADFIHKMSIAQKECNETIYWLELLHATDYLETSQFESINADAKQLMGLVTRIIKSSKGIK